MGTGEETRRGSRRPRGSRTVIRSGLEHQRTRRCPRGCSGRCARCPPADSCSAPSIQGFRQGAARELWIRYNTPHLEVAVAFAITTGVLGRETIPAELLEHLAGALRFYEEERATTS